MNMSLSPLLLTVNVIKNGYATTVLLDITGSPKLVLTLDTLTPPETTEPANVATPEYNTGFNTTFILLKFPSTAETLVSEAYKTTSADDLFKILLVFFATTPYTVTGTQASAGNDAAILLNTNF